VETLYLSARQTIQRGGKLAHHRRYAEKYLGCHAAFKSIAGLDVAGNRFKNI
jgi:hypothetical protein